MAGGDDAVDAGVEAGGKAVEAGGEAAGEALGKVGDALSNGPGAGQTAEQGFEQAGKNAAEGTPDGDDGTTPNAGAKDDESDDSKPKMGGSDDDEEDEEDEDASEEAGNDASEGTNRGLTRAFNKISEALKITVKALKGVFKVIKAIFTKIPFPWNLVVFLILVIIIVLIIVIWSFVSKFQGQHMETSYSSFYDTQDLNATRNYELTDEARAELTDVDNALKGSLSEEEYAELESNMEDIYIQLNDYQDTLNSYYDTNTGYAILNQDGTVLLLLERLSYAYKYTDWDIDYDTNGSLEKKYNDLEQEIIDNQGTWSGIKLRNKKEELGLLKKQIDELTYKLDRYKELNTLYKNKIDRDFVNSSKQSKVHPDGTPVENKAISYFKDRYGIDTTEVKEELNYYHTIIYRTFKWNSELHTSSYSDALDFILDPSVSLTSDDLEITTTGVDLSAVEKPFRVRFEMLHHEITLHFLNNNQSIQAIFAHPETKPRLMQALSSHMPIFEYATYSNQIAGKTFYNYELYDPNYFDEDGNYIFDNSFISKLDYIVSNPENDIDFSGVIALQDMEYELDRYKKQLEYQQAQDNPDLILIEELKELIAEKELELGNNSSSDALDEYNNRFKELLAKEVEMDDSYRPYDAHNHNIIVDTEGQYYTTYNGMMVDEYSVNVKIKEYLYTEINERPEHTRVTTGEWHETIYSPDINDLRRKYDVELDVTAKQSSLRPTKVRSILNSVDYEYTKTTTEAKDRSDIEILVSDERDKVKWERRAIYYTPIDEDGKIDEADKRIRGYEYRKTSNSRFTTGEKITSRIKPWDTNEDMYINTDTYLEDLYGQQELITTDSRTSNAPGAVGYGSVYNYTPGHIDVVYFCQRDYNEPYGKSPTGTVRGSGCGPTSMAMIVSTLTGVVITPPEMCSWAYDNGLYVEGNGTYISVFTLGAQNWGLQSRYINRNDKEGLVAALSAGHPVGMLCGKGDFTGGGHYIVLTGIDSNGQVSVADPNSREKSAMLWDIDRIMNNAIGVAQPYVEVW